MSNYTIKNVSSAEQLNKLITQFVAHEGWMPALDDHTLYYNTDPTGFFVGELDGEPISLISIVKYGDSFAFMGLYIVLEKYRRQGYGLALWTKALESCPFSYNIALDGVLSMTPLYRKWGFVDTFMSSKAQLNIATASTKLESFVPLYNVFVQPANQVDFNKLTVYDTDVFGAPHHLFLRGLVDGPNTITLVASNQNGGITGFVAARKTIIVEEGWKITPLYADNGQVARALLKAILKKMISNDPRRTVSMLLLASDTNPDTMTLSQEVDAVLLSDMCRMYTKGPLDFAKEKVYSYASAELG